MIFPHLATNSIPARQDSHKNGPRSPYLPPEAETDLMVEAPIDNRIVLQGMKKKSH